MKLLLVRHGQTDYNKADLIQGQEKDIPLNDEGRRQVQLTARGIPLEVSRIISSPLKRAFQTAEIINERLRKEIELRDELKEFKYGNLAGKSKSEIARLIGQDVDTWEKQMLFDYRPYGGENAKDVQRRVLRFIDDAKERFTDEMVLVTAHGGIIDAMHFLFPQNDRPEGENASVHEFDL